MSSNNAETLNPPLSVTKIIFWCYLGVSCCIYAPTTIYYTIEYSRILKSQLVDKRYPRIAIFTSLFGLISTIIRPSLLQFALCCDGNDSIYNDTFFDILHTFLYPIMTHGFLYIVLWRMYLLYYKFNYLYSLQQVSWMQHINKNIINTNWYILNFKTFGDPKWSLIYIFLPIYSILSTISIIIIMFGYHIDLIERNFALIIDSLIYFTPHIICWILYQTGRET